jgi:hypothetical protein
MPGTSAFKSLPGFHDRFQQNYRFNDSELANTPNMIPAAAIIINCRDVAWLFDFRRPCGRPGYDAAASTRVAEAAAQLQYLNCGIAFN